MSAAGSPASAGDLEVTRLGSGPGILFVHGSVVGAQRTWRHQLALAERYSLILPNRPGFGSSPALPRGDFEAEAPLFAELLGSGAHLVGHSPVFEAVCDAAAEHLGAERATIAGRKHTIPATGEPYNARLEAFLSGAQER